ncbi:MAG TPA: glycosyltransferase family 39 protein [Solirubrobacterales bacterium]|jgi:4-amino-4-deoxy-L-arabinose transferase-like glycosyltransferase
MERLTNWARTLPDRHGRTTLVLLALILALGFGLRAYRVVEPLPVPGDDAHAYYALAKALYEEGTYGGREFNDASDWSPGAPLLYAASFYATGGPREGTARIVEALLGLATIVVVYLLGRRLNCAPAGLIAAFGVAVYPPFIHSTGALYSEPPAILTLPAAVLAFLWAARIGADRPGARVLSRGQRGTAGGGVLTPPAPAPPATPGRGSEGQSISVASGPSESRGGGGIIWMYTLSGLLFGLTALARPEYLLVGVVFVVLAAIRLWQVGDGRPSPMLMGSVAMAAALVVPIVPWTVHNIVTLDRAVPISTGGGKALYVGTLLPADGEYERAKALLVKRYLHRDLEPGSEALQKVDPTPLFDRVAARHPNLPRDQALGRVGKEDFSEYFSEDPRGYLEMTARKVWRMWSGGVGEAMSGTPGRVIQVLIVVLGLGGFAVLGWRRRWWELTAMATPIVLVTLVGAATLAASRRNEVLMTLVFPLAGVTLARAGAALSSSGRWSRLRTSSPPN